MRSRLLPTPALLLGFLLATGTAVALDEPALAGHWVLDSERSDSAQRASRQALRDVRRVMQPRGNAPRPGTGAATRAEEVLAPLSPPTRQVRIELEDVEVIFHIDDRPARRYYTDGRAAVIDSSRPEQTIAAWEDGRLYVEQTFPVGTRIIEAWWLEGEMLRADFEARNSLFGDPIRFTLRFRRSGTRP
ncbi:MAG: hypothetical protein JJT88_20690 [Gammaproteobacteria bacterium]|nr:hypothetical protein [Gammaproteobacteria bacterium]